MVTYPISYCNDPSIVGKIDNFVSINNCISVDLYGQICAESAGTRQISGTGGQLDFLESAAVSKGGKAFICMTSSFTNKEGETVSRINPLLSPGDIVTDPRSLAYYIVTEYGGVNLVGCSTWERAEKLISIAHPDFREELIAAIARVRQVHVDDQIYDYIARLAEVTRTHPLLKLGISPRGALALCRTGKARAFAEGRDFVVPEDVTQMAEYVFAHRLMLSSKARLNEYTPEAIVAEVLAQTQPPVLSERRA